MSSEDTKAIRDAYFNACNFESLMRGIHFAVFWMALVHIYTGQQRGPSHTMAFLVVAMFIMSTVHHATFWAYVRRAFIAHGETSESVAAALGEYPDWFTGTTSISDANAVLADGILIWRTWIVWGRNWWVIIAPVATTLLTAAFSIIATYGVVSSTTFGAVGVDYATALYSTSLVTTVVCTCLIVFRILSVSQYKKNAWRSYRNIMEILIESALLYSVATLFALLAYIYSGEASEYASAFWTSITGIAPTLIIARVASGESRPEDTWREGTTHSGSTIPRFRFMKGRADNGTVSDGSPTNVETFVAAIPMGSLRSEGEISSGILSTQHSQGVSDVKKRDLDSEV